MNKIEEGKEYLYKDIEEYARRNKYILEEYGHEIIGMHFLTLDGNHIFSFVLSSANAEGYYYKCIFNSKFFKS